MSETKAEKEARESHEEYERQQTKAGKEVYLPRAGEPGAPTTPDDGKEKSKK